VWVGRVMVSVSLSVCLLTPVLLPAPALSSLPRPLTPMLLFFVLSLLFALFFLLLSRFLLDQEDVDYVTVDDKKNYAKVSSPFSSSPTSHTHTIFLLSSSHHAFSLSLSLPLSLSLSPSLPLSLLYLSRSPLQKKPSKKKNSKKEDL
jgi:hypothetical protein